MLLHSKGEIVHDPRVLEHSSFKCFQDRADKIVFFGLYSEKSTQGSTSYLLGGFHLLVHGEGGGDARL